MRVTQSMLSNNMLRNVSNSYSKLSKLQDQLATQKKITKPSDDPVVAMLGISYRSDVNRISQYKDNISEVSSWLDATDDAIGEGVKVLQRIRELVVQASNDTYEESQRQSIAVEIKQLKDHLLTIGNTQVGGKYIFNGRKTNERPDGNFSEGYIDIDVFDGISMVVNTNGKELFGNLIQEADPAKGIDENGTLAKLIETLESEDSSDADIGAFLDEIDKHIDNFLKQQANIGARQNRVDLMKSRLDSQEVISTEVLSKNEDVDIEKVITELITQESIHRAALSVGSRVIQPTLMDFLR